MFVVAENCTIVICFPSEIHLVIRCCQIPVIIPDICYCFALQGRYTTLNATPEVESDVLRVHDEAFRWLHPFYSESNSFLEIQNVDSELPCDKDQEVLVDYILDRKELDPEANHLDFYYLVST